MYYEDELMSLTEVLIRTLCREAVLELFHEEHTEERYLVQTIMPQEFL